MDTPSRQDTRMAGPVEYDPRYLAGILHFNRGDYFEAHEVWEDLWHDKAGPDRRFYQGLIQAGGSFGVHKAAYLFLIFVGSQVQLDE